MKHAILLSFMLMLGFAASAQVFVGTLKIDGKIYKDVNVRYTVNGDTATVVIYRVIYDNIIHGTVDLTVPDIRITETAQRSSLICYNIMPLNEGKDYPDYFVRKFRGTKTTDVLTFSCTMNERKVTYSGVVNKRYR